MKCLVVYKFNTSRPNLLFSFLKVKSNSELWELFDYFALWFHDLDCDYSFYSSHYRVLGSSMAGVWLEVLTAGKLQCVHLRSTHITPSVITSHGGDGCWRHPWGRMNKYEPHGYLKAFPSTLAITLLFVSIHLICGGNSAMQVKRLKCLRGMPYVSLHFPQ